MLTSAGVAAVLLVAGCAGGSVGTGSVTPGEQVAGAAPQGTASLDFQATTVDGEAFDAATLQGRPTVLWFWAPWCTICRVEAPDVLAVAQANSESVSVIGVAGRGEVEAMQDFVTDTASASLTHVVDRDGTVWRAFGVVSQPAFAFVSATGDVEVFTGSLGEEALGAAVGALAAGSP